MEDRLRKHIDDIFNGTAHTRKAVELKEEMIQNLHDKYDDLISEGKTPEAAFNIAIAGIGDVSGLLKELEADTIAPDAAKLEAARQKSAMFTAIAVMMYILCVLPLIILHQMGVNSANSIGVPIMFIMIAGATGLLVYSNMTKPRLYKDADNMVEEFREWQSGEHHRKSLRRAISSALWAVIIVLYFVISFWTQAWYITWIIFLMGTAVEAFINIFYTLKK